MLLRGGSQKVERGKNTAQRATNGKNRTATSMVDTAACNNAMTAPVYLAKLADQQAQDKLGPGLMAPAHVLQQRSHVSVVQPAADSLGQISVDQDRQAII